MGKLRVMSSTGDRTVVWDQEQAAGASRDYRWIRRGEGSVAWEEDPMSQVSDIELRGTPGHARGGCGLCRVDYGSLSGELVLRRGDEMTHVGVCALCQTTLTEFFRWVGGEWDEFQTIRLMVS